MFPILGVKLRNSGNATAVIWSLEVVVERVEVDEEPVLDAVGYTSGHNGPNLSILISDSGWGASRSYSFTINGATLDRLAGKDALRSIASLAGGGSVELSVKYDRLDQQLLHQMLNDLRDERDRRWRDTRGRRLATWVENERLRRIVASTRNVEEAKRAGFANRLKWPFDLPDPLPIEPIDLAWAEREFARVDPVNDTKHVVLDLGDLWIDYKSQDGAHEGSLPMAIGHFGGVARITAHGFEVREDRVAACMAMPDSRYAAVLDVDRGIHTRSYKISRNIDPGDADFFQVEIAANKSCTMNVRLRLAIDRDQVLQTESVTLRIRNTRDDRFHERVIDGGTEMLWPEHCKRPISSRWD